MQIELSTKLEKSINTAMLAGNYESAEKCILAAIKALKLQWLNKELQIGIDQLDRGEGELYDREKINKEVEKQLKSM